MSKEDELSLLKTPKEKALHLSTQFGTKAIITQIYQRIADLVSDNPTEDELNSALDIVEKEFDIK